MRISGPSQMILFRIFLLFLGTLAIPDGLFPCAHGQAAAANLPANVMAFIGRRGSCWIWSKRATDAKDAAQLDAAAGVMRSMKCSDIANDERVLRETYAGNPDILSALDATWVKVVKRLPVRIAVPSELDH
jgi:hypothetical protein